MACKLSRPEIDVNKSDNDGESPILWAAYNNNLGVLRALMDRNDTIIDKVDNLGKLLCVH